MEKDNKQRFNPGDHVALTNINCEIEHLIVTNGTDLNTLFSAKLLGGGRGYADALALETFSNDFTPTIKCLQGFTLIVEVDDQD